MSCNGNLHPTPSTERAHFSQYKSAKTLYDAVVARYSSPATTALSRLMLPYLFPDLAAFATVTDLITHLRTSDTRYHTAEVAIFDLDFDAILAATYAVSISAEGDCYVCVPPDPGIEATALGASESAAPESPPVVASGQVAVSSQVLAAASQSRPESAPCSCCLLSHQTLLWHHRLGHPSLPRLRGMASRVLVSGLPRSFPPLPLGPAPTCIPCVEGRQCAAPHSSEFPPTKAPLQTLHMDVWGPSRVRGQGHERYFLLVVDDYSRYTTVFPLRSTQRAFRLGLSCSASALRQRRTVFLRPSASLLLCGGHPPDVHASGLSTAKWDC
ncbi:unnamed protein product [Closterium sp. NIES-53]